MTTVINTNVPAIIAKSNMDRVQRELENSITKLSSGQRINKAADDAAGMAVANRMESQIRGLTMAIRHGKDGQNLVDTADGAQIEIGGNDKYISLCRRHWSEAMGEEIEI